MRRERILFPGAMGERLAALLDLPEEKPIAFVLFAHCFTCSKDLTAVTRISYELTQTRLATFRFDFTGLGHSDGEFANTNFSSNVQDLIAAADYLRTHHQAPQILVGHSLGGTAVLASAKEIPEAKAVATIGAPFEPAELIHLLPGDALEAINSAGRAEVSIGGRIFHIKKQFLEDINEQNMSQHVAGLGKALLVFHSPNDEIVRPENADKIYQAAEHPKSLVSLDDADHLLTRKEDAEYVAVVLSAWASRYIDGRETKP